MNLNVIKIFEVYVVMKNLWVCTKKTVEHLIIYRILVYTGHYFELRRNLQVFLSTNTNNLNSLATNKRRTSKGYSLVQLRILVKSTFG